MKSYCCKRVQEKSEVIKYICINDDCQNMSICCELCKQEIHKNHQSDCKLLKKIMTKISEDYTKNESQIIQEIQVVEIILKECIGNIQKYLKNIYKIPIEEDELIFNLDYVHLRKSQIRYFLQLQEQLEQQLNQLKSICNQFENKNAVILQDISQCEIDINKLKQQLSYQTIILPKPNIQTMEKQEEFQQSIQENNVQESYINSKITFLSDDEKLEIQQDDSSLISQDNKSELSSDFQQEMQYKEYYYQENIIEPQKVQNPISFYLLFNSGKILVNQPQIAFEYNQYQRIHQIVNRPEQYFCNPKGQNVFASDGINVKICDVIPFKGITGCFHEVMYYLASYCPQQLYDVFKTKEISSNGLYEFVIKDKTHSDVLLQIDDTIPNSLDKRMLFSKNNSICFTMLMKAIAQNFQSQQKIQNYQYYLQFLIQIFKMHILLLRQNLMTLLNSKSLILYAFKKESQIKSTQVLDLVNVKNIFNEETLLFRLRSACGRDIYQGEWGFQSPIWTHDIKKQLNVSNEDDGIFYMDLLSFIQEPQLIYSFRINQKLSAYQKFFIKKNQASYFRLEVHQKDNYAIKIEHLQNFDQFKTKFKIPISEIQSKQLVGVHLQELGFSVPQVLNKGIYIIYIKSISQIEQDISEGNISIFGSQVVELIQIQKIENYKYQVFENELKQKGQISENFDFVQIKEFNLDKKGWYIKQFINISKNSIISIQQQQQAVKKYRISKPFNDKLINQQLFSNQQLTIIFKMPQDDYKLPDFHIFKDF